EIYQNCNIFNDGAFKSFSERDVRDDKTISLEHGKPLIFGKEKNMGIRLAGGLKPEIVKLGNGVGEEGLLVHDEKAESPALAYLLAQLSDPDFPVPLGVYRCVEKP